MGTRRDTEWPVLSGQLFRTGLFTVQHILTWWELLKYLRDRCPDDRRWFLPVGSAYRLVCPPVPNGLFGFPVKNIDTQCFLGIRPVMHCTRIVIASIQMPSPVSLMVGRV